MVKGGEGMGGEGCLWVREIGVIGRDCWGIVEINWGELAE